MFIRLLFFFTLVPILELYVILAVGNRIGAGPTMALILITGLAGAYLTRSQGFGILHQIRIELAVGRIPAGALLDGVMVLIGGVLLLTPGFCTDVAGFILLVPRTRAFARRLLGACRTIRAEAKIWMFENRF
jgi:UPF0716 protein FxsA